MRLPNLASLERSIPGETTLAGLPREIVIARYAMQKAFSVNRLIRRIFGVSFEWYGFTLGNREYPECITDIGLPANDRNIHRYSAIGPENISRFQDSLPADTVVNGWIHSHGDVNLREFSRTDEANHLAVLDYVGTILKKPVARREVLIDDLLLISDEGITKDSDRGSVWLFTDKPVSRARLFELIYGSFCFAVLIGDAGWHIQDIYRRTRGILTGTTSVEGRRAEMVLTEPDRVFSEEDEDALATRIRETIHPEFQEDTSGPAHSSRCEAEAMGND